MLCLACSRCPLARLGLRAACDADMHPILRRESGTFRCVNVSLVGIVHRTALVSSCAPDVVHDQLSLRERQREEATMRTSKTIADTSTELQNVGLGASTQGEVGCLVFAFPVAIRTLSSLCVLSRSGRLPLPCVFCRDPGDCLSLVPVLFGRVGFLVSDVRRWLSNTEEEVLGVGEGQGRKSSGRCDHN